LNQEDYKSIYHDILNGYSTYSDDEVFFYIKHFCLKDLNLINQRKAEVQRRARKLGLLDEETQIKNLIEKDNWSKDKENEIIRLNQFIKDLKYTKSKLIVTRDIENINNQIKDAEKNLNIIIKEKEELLGTTLESYTNKKISEYYVYISLYQDIDLKNRYLTAQQFEDLEYEELYKLYFKYNIGIAKLSEKNLKKIALSNFFLNSFYLCNDDPYTFFGKPVVDLTFTQTELFSLAKYFKNIITNSTVKPPDNVLNDPDALIDWYEGSKNASKAIGKAKGKNQDEVLGTSVVGASKGDLKRIGMENKDGIDLAKEAAKKGGSLSFQDLIKLHNA
jgi:hypothetical protein